MQKRTLDEPVHYTPRPVVNDQLPMLSSASLRTRINPFEVKIQDMHLGQDNTDLVAQVVGELQNAVQHRIATQQETAGPLTRADDIFPFWLRGVCTSDKTTTQFIVDLTLIESREIFLDTLLSIILDFAGKLKQHIKEPVSTVTVWISTTEVLQDHPAVIFLSTKKRSV